MLGRTDRDKLFARVNIKEMVADFIHFTQFGGNMLVTEMADIQPEMFAISGFNTFALTHVVGHPTGNNITGGQFCLCRFVNVHEPFFVNIKKSSAVTATTFGHQNIGRYDSGGVELDGFRVTDRYDPGVMSKDVSAAVADNRVGGCFIDAPETACADGSGLGEEHFQLARTQAADNRTGAFVSVMDERDCFLAVKNIDSEFGTAVVHGTHDCVSGSVGSIAGTPFGSTAEGTGGNQAALFLFFFFFKFLATFEIEGFTGNYTVPGHTPVCKSAHLNGSCVCEKTGHFLVTAPVGTANSVAKVDVYIVSLALSTVAQRGLHAALCCR